MPRVHNNKNNYTVSAPRHQKKVTQHATSAKIHSHDWLEILEFAPPNVSGSISSGANFGGLSSYRAYSGFKRGPASGWWDWSPRISRFLDRIPI
ncbi:hypothetical protein MTR_5g027520 [Medicago truncatula]|uniref:Uncharacterized protein n=1 Tax=Medicago truncatula TaxID=3880 RepID=G7K881_MEDTR|nr:hypothetical protein MTR_5g027520 [Medicago truncatula]